MTVNPSRRSSVPWLRWVLGAIFLVALGLRLWRLGQLNTLVFDEVYYPVLANRYLMGEYVYNSHPPLSQYFIAVGIWLGSHLPIGQDMVNGLTGTLRSTFSYRWFNAIAGAWIPVVLGLIAFHLSRSRVYGAIAALIALLDGLFLVESRYGLSNIYLILFGLLGHLCLLMALGDRPPPRNILRRVRVQSEQGNGVGQLWQQIREKLRDRRRYRRSWQRWQGLALAGICLGGAIAVKWNGLGFLLTVYGLWLVGQWRKPSPRHPLGKLARLQPFTFLGYFAVIPFVTYCLLWIPHLLLNPQLNLWQLHASILNFHHAVGSGAAVHPYCSPWYSWPLMARPVAYFYATATDLRSLVPMAPPVPRGFEQVVYAVHAMGNPILWWLATGAIAALLINWVLIRNPLYLHQESNPPQGRETQSLRQENSSGLTFGFDLTRSSPNTSIWLYCLWGYGANLLPWAAVSRCTFLYHYMAAFTFAQLALAYWLWQGVKYSWPSRIIALSVLILGSLAFWFWLPIYLGLPLTPASYQLRMWFERWI